MPLPVLTERLKIWMLPTVAVIKHEKTTDYVVGLDELGGVEDFSTGLSMILSFHSLCGSVGQVKAGSVTGCCLQLVGGRRGVKS